MGAGTAVVVDTSSHRLWLCEGGAAKKTFAVALGRGGVGKRKEGDAKTPLGTYALGAPRASTQFGTFIPVGYPTKAQARQGLTGRDVGVHGPPRGFRWAGDLTQWIDWTLGCIAVPTDDEIAEIAKWVRAHPAAPITLRAAKE